MRQHARSRRRRGRALLTVLAIALGALAGAFGGTEAASAHAVLVSSSPADGSSLTASPVKVVLTFDEHIQLVPGAARVISSTGVRADTGEARLTAAGTGITIPLHPRLPRGSYTVTWRVVSADTHIVAGSIAFGVRQAASERAHAAAPPNSLDILAQTAQGFGYAGAVLCFGIPAVNWTLWRNPRHARSLRILTRVGWFALLVAALLDFLLQGPRAADTGWPGVLRFADLGQTVASAYGVALICRVLCLVAIAIIAKVGRARRWSRISLGVLAVAVLVTIGLGGHAGTGPDVPIALTAATLHLASMSVWVGGLLVLLIGVLPGFGTGTAALGSLRRWSLTAFGSVVVLILSGEYQAWRQIQPVPSLWTTSYGITLLIKLGLVCVALAFALLSQRSLQRRPLPAGDGSPATRIVQRIRNGVIVETAIVTVVVAVTTVLTASPPPSSTYGPAASLTAALGDQRHLAVEISGTGRGPEDFTITAERADGTAIPAQRMTAVLSSRENGVSAIAVRLRRDGDHWRSVNAVVPLAGTWTITFDVSIDAVSAYATRVTYPVW